MAIRTTAEILEKVSTLFPDEPDDAQLELLEDISDTLADASQRDAEDWKAKYEELDRTWRSRYKERFMRGPEEQERTKIELEIETPNPEDAPKTFEELFKEVK